MNVKQHILLLLILGILGVSACHWFEEDPSKEEKIKAKGIFDIYINGELFDINGFNVFKSNPDVSYTEFNGSFFVIAENRKDGQYFHFTADAIKGQSRVGMLRANLMFLNEMRCDLPREYLLLEDGKDYVEFTEPVDKENDIIVGEFGFTLIDTCALDTIYVEGIFDEHYTL